MSDWTPMRRLLAALALLTAVLTGVTGVAMGGTAGHAFAAAVFVGLAVAAAVSRGAIPWMIVAGQGFAASLLFTPVPLELLSLLPIVGGVLVSAELLAVVGRLEPSFARDPSDDLRRVGISALIGVGVFAVVAAMIGALDRIPVPTGLAAVALAVGACVVLAVLFIRAGRRGVAGADDGPT
ncbi:MAG: hypothetical protein EA351_11440 [Gemmatimonadales bacterium]|nr:MAG: hypothetical protein EA351_11440 [Gemmatimonadales bacterium]